MNWVLSKKEIKSNFWLYLIILAVLTMYATIVVSMYNPAATSSLEEMAKTMPQIFDAFGMGKLAKHLIDFIINYLYGFLFLVFPLIFTIIVTNRLITQYVDRGAMVYLLTSGIKRGQLIRNQIALFILAQAFICFYLTVLLDLTAWLWFPKEDVLIALIKTNFGLFGLHLFLGSIAFVSASFFNESKKATAFTASVVIYSLLLQMLAQLGDKLDFLNYLTPFTLFDPTGLVENHASAWLFLCLLFILAAIGFILASKIFKYKDLPI